jgi:general secretion pathway protein J
MTRVAPRRDQAGMTLLEVLVALTILSVIVAVLLAGLRVGVRAWESGERRAAAQQELRAVIELLTEALATAAPYRGRLGDAPDRVTLFQGEADEIRFVTSAPPLVLDVPAAPFHAVTVRRTSDDQLRLVERMVPADEPFGQEGARAVLSRAVTGFKVEYRDGEGAWVDRWDPRNNRGLPAAVRVALTVQPKGQNERTATFVVPIALGRTGLGANLGGPS